MLNLILSPSWRENRQVLLEKLCGEIAGGQNGCILLVPEQISHDTERELCALAGDTASRCAEVLSFSRLASRVFALYGGAARQTMDKGGRLIAMAAAVEQLRPKLKAYAAACSRPEFLTALVTAIDECKSGCVTAEDLLAAAGQTEGALAQKLEELSLLLDCYDGVCANGRLDPRDRMTKLLETLECQSFAREHRFYIDGFVDFTGQELGILEHLLEESPHVCVTLACEEPGDPAQGRDLAGDTAKRLLRLAAKHEVRVQIEKPILRRDAMASVRDGLFQGPCAPVGEALHVYRGPDPWAECLYAGRRVKELIAGGARYRDISVAYTDGGRYAPMLDLIFARLGIPCYFSGTEDILHKSVMHMAVSALDAAVGGLERKDVLRYLKSALSPLSREEADQVENYAILWGISGSGWASAWRFHPGGRGKEPDEGSNSALEALNDSRTRGVLPLVRLRQELLRARNIRESLVALGLFFERIGLETRLDSMARELEDRGDLRGAQELSQLWEILIGAMEQMEELLGDTQRDGASFARLFRLQLSQYDVGTIPPVLDRVTAGELSAMRRNAAKHLILLGAEEGLLPGYGSAAGVLTQTERETLQAMGLGLTGGQSWSLQQDFATILAAFSCPTVSTAVTCGGAQCAYLFRRLCRMAGAEEELVRPAPWEPDFEPTAAGAACAAAGVVPSVPLPGYAEARRGMDYAPGSLGRQTVEALYGRVLRLSASQVDQLASCRLAYFLRYGLHAEPRKDHSVESTEFGSFVHEVLEKTVRTVMARGGFCAVTQEETWTLALGYAEAYMDRVFADLDEGSRRTSYLFRRNLEELELVVRALWTELNQSDFCPAGEEVQFGMGPESEMPAIELLGGAMPARLRGSVDRVDLFERNGQIYLRVIDYKTGKKSVDYCDIIQGIGLQMLLYLFALRSWGQLAGVLYYPARVPVVSADGPQTQEQAQALRRKNVRREGLVLDDEQILAAMDHTEDLEYLPCKRRGKTGEISGNLVAPGQWSALERYIRRLLAGLVDRLAGGCVDADPYFRGDANNACRYCKFGSVCSREGQTGKRSFRRISEEEFWEQIEREDVRHG